jgi:hypothetical protein
VVLKEGATLASANTGTAELPVGLAPRQGSFVVLQEGAEMVAAAGGVLQPRQGSFVVLRDGPEVVSGGGVLPRQGSFLVLKTENSPEAVEAGAELASDGGSDDGSTQGTAASDPFLD